jgi:1-acyl-sn-glycerol-3-phosphate acyltransferase
MTQNSRPTPVTPARDGKNMADDMEKLLSVVAEVVDELHPGQGLGQAVGLDVSLDSHLGLDSLSRVELVNRLERSFDISLPEAVIQRAETPRDLWRELSTSSPPGAKKNMPDDVELKTGSTATPEHAETLNEVLEWHAQTHPDDTHIRLIQPDDENETISFRVLYNEALLVASGLIDQNLAPGECVLLMLPTGRDYFVSFFGVLLAGGVPVPVYPPGRPQQMEEHLLRHAKIAERAQAGIMITVAEALPFAKLMSVQSMTLRSVVTREQLAAATIYTPLPQASPTDTAFLQFTSGSTGDPKGVILSHANLLANIRAMGRQLQASPDDVFVSWLPLYHDMGLIGAWLGSLTYGIPLVIMSPLTFLARPQRWLQTISEYSGTISGAPNFAYEMCVNRLRDEDLEDVDLSSWRVAFNGAEAVSPATMERFCDRFATYGFKRESLMAVYGLAENSVGLAFPPLGRGPKADSVNREKLALSGEAIPVEADHAGATIVPACGLPLPGHEIRVVDDTGHELGDRRQGRIQFRGPSATSGYYRNDDATRALFDGDWQNTGDLGYLSEGEIYITGREKDLIIRAGRNIYPTELEEAIGAIDGIQAGNVAVFGNSDRSSGAERLIVMAESRRRGDNQQADIKRKIIGMVTDLAGAAPDEILLVPPRSVPKTSSGKIRRQSAKALYETGQAGKSSVSVNLQIFRVALMSILPSVRRGIRTTGSWLYAIYAWLMLIVAAVPAWILVAITPLASLRWSIVRGILKLLTSLCGIRISVEGQENIPRDQAFLYAVNHASYIDGPVLLSALPGRFSFVAKGELKNSFIARLFLSRLGTHFVDRFETDKSLDDARALTAAIKNGQRLVYFPEGTFTRMSGLLPFHMGAFTTAVKAGIVVVPVVLRGTRSILRDDSGFPRPGRVRILILPPQSPAEHKVDENWTGAIELRDRVRSMMLAHNGEPDLAHERVSAALTEMKAND